MTTPVVIDGRIYFHLRSQRIQCLDSATGQERWTSGKASEKYWSLVSNGDRMLALDERGDLLLIRANPETLDVQDRRRVAAKESWAHLAVVDEPDRHPRSGLGDGVELADRPVGPSQSFRFRSSGACFEIR